MRGRTPIPEELATFLESGLSIVVGTRDPELQPDGSVAWAVRVAEDGTHLTVFLYVDAAREMLSNLERCPEIALDFDRPTTHQACQVKGRLQASRRARKTERPIVDAQVDGFARELEAIGIPRAMNAGWKTWPCTALEVEVTDLFEQAPGPGAGERLP